MLQMEDRVTTIKVARQVGACIRARRLAVGMTQEELARNSDVSVRTIISVELGDNTNVGFGKLLAICNAVGLRMMLEDDEPMSRENSREHGGYESVDEMIDAYLSSLGRD